MQDNVLFEKKSYNEQYNTIQLEKNNRIQNIIIGI